MHQMQIASITKSCRITRYTAKASPASARAAVSVLASSEFQIVSASAAIQATRPSTATGMPARTAYFESCTVSQPPLPVQISAPG